MKKIGKFLRYILAGLCVVVMSACGTITINFVTNNGTNLDSIKLDGTEDAEDINRAISTLTKTDYEVEGLYFDAEFTNKWNGSSKIEENATLYVKWQGKNYNIIFNANGGTGTMENQTIRFGQSANLTSNAFTKTGYRFAGWKLSTDATSSSKSDGSAYTMESCPNGKNFYAHWVANNYSVAFNANGGTGSMDSMSLAYDSSANLVENSFTKTGHYFNGWNTNADGSGANYANGANITMNSTSGINLFAKWATEKYNIVLKDASGATLLTLNNVEYGTKINEATGFNADTITSATTGTAIPEGKTFDGFFIKDGNSYTGSSYNLTSNLDDMGNNGDSISLYIRWANQTGTVGVNYNEATSGNSVTSINTVYGTAIGTLPTPTKDGYTFIGWYSSNTMFTSATKLSSETIWTDNFDGIYAKWVDSDESFNYIYNGNGGSVETTGSYTKNYNISSNSIQLVNASRTGYTFTGWELEKDAYLNGVLVSAGTKLNKEMVGIVEYYFIPANSWGTIRIKATWQIEEHSVTFKVRNQADTEWITLGSAFVADYGTQVNTLDGYDARFGISMDNKEGFVFDGWYISNSTFTSSNRFGGLITEHDISVFPHYVKILSAPTNIAMSQENSLLSWDAIAGADGYEVIVDGGEPYTTNTNSLDIPMVTNAADSYVITVKAVSDYTSLFNKKIDSELSTFNFTRKTSLSNALQEIRDEEGLLEKYILFTGKTYIFNSSEYTVGVENLSSEGIVGVNVITDPNNSAKKISTVTVGDTAGTFDFVIEFLDSRPDKSYNARIVEDVLTIEKGDAYTQYLNASSEEVEDDYLNATVTPFAIGAGNGLALDIELKNGGTSFDEYAIMDEELVTYTWEVLDETLVTPAYRTATESEKPVKGSDLNIGKWMFPAGEENANIGKTYRATVALKFVSQKGLGLSTSFEFKLNDGYNAHTNAELQDLYGNKDVHLINIIKNITASLRADQMQEDGSPINTKMERIFDNDDTTSNNATDSSGNATPTASRKTDGNIYKRANTVENDRVVVNGNYATIDATNIKVVNKEHSLSYGSGTDGINSATGLQSNSVGNFDLLRPHTGVFYYRSNNGGLATFNNLTILGNNSQNDVKRSDFVVGDEEGQYKDTNSADAAYLEALDEQSTRDSGSVCGFYIESSAVTINGVNIYHTHEAVRMDGCIKNFAYTTNLETGNKQKSDFVHNTAICEMNYSKVVNTYASGIYSWQGKAFGIYNSYFNDCNGPAIQMDVESTNMEPIVAIDKNTVINNYMTGTESWFSLWGVTSLAQKLKAELQPILNSMGMGILKETSADGYTATNMIMVFRPGSKQVAGYNEYGEYFSNISLNSKITTFIGGEKEYIEYDNSGNIVAVGEGNGVKIPATTGLKTVRCGANVFAPPADVRVQDGIYAFSLTQFSSKEEFDTACNLIGAMMTINNLAGNNINGTGKTLFELYQNADSEAFRADIKSQFDSKVVSDQYPYTFAKVFDAFLTNKPNLFGEIVSRYLAEKSTFDDLISKFPLSNAVTVMLMHAGIDAFEDTDGNSAHIFEVITKEGAAPGSQVIYIEYGFIGDGSEWISGN